MKHSCASYLKWSHEGEHFLCCIVTPKLRVDNGYKVYNHTGSAISSVSFKDSELYNVNWIPGGSINLSKNFDLPQNSNNSVKKIANFAREEDDFMMSMKADRNKVEKINTKEIREQNEEFLFQKGIVIQKNQEENLPQEKKPQRVPGAPSPEPKKRKRNRKKKGDGEK